MHTELFHTRRTKHTEIRPRQVLDHRLWNTVKNIIRNCVRCHRFAAKAQQQILTYLPSMRVTTGKLFNHFGIDYAGPLELRSSELRKAAIVKVYFCVFVCLKTKSIHLEIATDQSSNGQNCVYQGLEVDCNSQYCTRKNKRLK